MEDDLLKVTLLSTSDVHGFYIPWDYSKDEEVPLGGLSRVSTVVNKIREENPHTVLIDNGDLIQGNSAEFFLAEDKYPGIEVINKMKYEIYNMGNHEFNFGMNHLIHVVSQFNGVSMMGNLYRKKNNIRFMNGIYYKNIEGIRIGFISLNTPLVRRFEAKRGNLKNYDVTDANKELELLLDEVGEVDAIIGLFHMGDFNENDIPFTGVKDLLQGVKGASKIDAVFGGHMHQFVNTKINDTYFLEPGSFAKGLGRLDLYFDHDKKLVKIEPSIIKIDSSIERDYELEKLINNYHIKLRDYINEPVGYLSSPLYDENDIKNIPQTRVADTKIANFFIDVFKKFSTADVFAIHFDNLWPEINNKIVLRKDIFNSYLYAGGEITDFEITGEDLWKYMEWSVAFYNQAKKGDINISFNSERTKSKYSTLDLFGNIKYEINLTKEVGNRIQNIRYMDDTPILLTDDITIGMNKYRMDFLTSDMGPLKGKKFDFVWTSINAKELNVKGNIRNLAIKYIQELEKSTYTPKETKNWKILRYDDDKEQIAKAIQLINENKLLLYHTSDGVVDLNRSLNINDELEDYQLNHLSKYYDLKGKTVLKDILDLIKL